MGASGKIWPRFAAFCCFTILTVPVQDIKVQRQRGGFPRYVPLPPPPLPHHNMLTIECRNRSRLRVLARNRSFWVRREQIRRMSPVWMAIVDADDSEDMAIFLNVSPSIFNCLLEVMRQPMQYHSEVTEGSLAILVGATALAHHMRMPGLFRSLFGRLRILILTCLRHGCPNPWNLDVKACWEVYRIVDLFKAYQMLRNCPELVSYLPADSMAFLMRLLVAQSSPNLNLVDDQELISRFNEIFTRNTGPETIFGSFFRDVFAHTGQPWDAAEAARAGRHWPESLAA